MAMYTVLSFHFLWIWIIVVTILYDSDRNTFGSSKLFQNTRTNWCISKYDWGCHACGLLTFRVVDLPEQRHLKQKLNNASVCTFILASVNSTAFCLEFWQTALFQTDAFNYSFNWGFLKSLTWILFHWLFLINQVIWTLM